MGLKAYRMASLFWIRILLSAGLKAESADIEKVLEDVIRKADKTLYIVKDQGKNCSISLI